MHHPEKQEPPGGGGSHKDPVQGGAPGQSLDTPSPVTPQAAPASSWRNHLRVHPAADLLPLMSKDELQELAEDIRANGLKEKIKLYFDMETTRVYLVDGRNRADALSLIGQSIFDEDGKPKFDYFQYIGIASAAYRDDHPPFDPFTYVISLNIKRRHLTAEQKRDVIAKLLKAKPEQSNRQTAKLVGADHKTVAAVRTELEVGGEIPHVKKTVGADGKSYPKKAKPEQPVETTTAADDDIAKHVATAESTDERDRLYGPLTGWEWIELGSDCWCRAIRTGPAKRPGCYSDNYLKLIEHHNVPVLRWNEEERRQEEGDGGA